MQFPQNKNLLFENFEFRHFRPIWCFLLQADVNIPIVTTRPFSLPCYLQGIENGRVVTIGKHSRLSRQIWYRHRRKWRNSKFSKRRFLFCGCFSTFWCGLHLPTIKFCVRCKLTSIWIIATERIVFKFSRYVSILLLCTSVIINKKKAILADFVYPV
jgi:hypothetical protein